MPESGEKAESAALSRKQKTAVKALMEKCYRSIRVRDYGCSSGISLMLELPIGLLKEYRKIAQPDGTESFPDPLEFWNGTKMEKLMRRKIKSKEGSTYLIEYVLDGFRECKDGLAAHYSNLGCPEGTLFLDVYENFSEKKEEPQTEGTQTDDQVSEKKE